MSNEEKKSGIILRGRPLLILMVIVFFLPFSSRLQHVSTSQVFYFIPGAAYFSNHPPNIFSTTMCSYLCGLLEEDFKVIQEPLSKNSFSNVCWALYYGQYPIRNPERNHKVVVAFNRILSDTLNQPDEITIISSSFGTVLASQLVLQVFRHYQYQPSQPKVNLILGASMVCRESPLFRELLKLREEGFISLIVYDELQDEGDNVTGMCGKTRVEAFANALKITFVLDRNHRGQPSILHSHPTKGHIHWKRAQSVKKGRDFVRVILIDHELAGPNVRERAREVLSQAETIYPVSSSPAP